ncbi:hypothetical protein LPB19_15810 [Marinobacter salinisoli]|uniref:Uncharacterized protein n=1 Tax=Marinobacter salinisoli TaxID=2769486 RepID=A0ABX7MU45_9GAMM|nr:hypothetical protein [Marinobacter salinisoli]QSP94616.1 hypothetical protein LPB19_15810 [Marinobacter salinisoli]
MQADVDTFNSLTPNTDKEPANGQREGAVPGAIGGQRKPGGQYISACSDLGASPRP